MMRNGDNFTSSSFTEVTSSTDGSVIKKIAYLYNWIFYTVISQSVALFGVGTNIINIICFVKQGFKDPVNVSLFGMAISDLGSLTTIMWSYLCMNPAFSSSDLSFDPIEVQYLISGMPHVTFASITAWITALVTLERCLCITAPLKIKTIITPRRITIIVVCIFIILISCQTPVYIVNRLDMKYFPDRNKTLIGLVHTKDRDRVEGMSYIINNFFLPFCAFLVIIVCTIILVIELKIKTKWRKKSTSTVNSENMSSRSEKVGKMVVMISALFIACFIPTCVLFVAMSMIPNFSMTGKYKDYVIMISGVGLLLESINSSSNIFIYYSMSIKYKNVFKQTFYKKHS